MSRALYQRLEWWQPALSGGETSGKTVACGNQEWRSRTCSARENVRKWNASSVTNDCSWQGMARYSSVTVTHGSRWRLHCGPQSWSEDTEETAANARWTGVWGKNTRKSSRSCCTENDRLCVSVALPRFWHRGYLLYCDCGYSNSHISTCYAAVCIWENFLDSDFSSTSIKIRFRYVNYVHLKKSSWIKHLKMNSNSTPICIVSLDYQWILISFI